MMNSSSPVALIFTGLPACRDSSAAMKWWGFARPRPVNAPPTLP